MSYFYLMIIVFIIGYIFIVFEHVSKINKASIALLMGVLLWSIYSIWGEQILGLGFSKSWKVFSNSHAHFKGGEIVHFVTHFELMHHLSEIASIILFLIGAMTIVEAVDKFQGFRIITTRINSNNKVRLLWVIGFLSFFMSAFLDNLTTTIIMVALLRKILSDKENRWLFASIVVICANAGGAWSPIGDITTIMLWIGGQITATSIVKSLLLPSLVSTVVPLTIMSFIIRGKTETPVLAMEELEEFTTLRERIFMLSLGALSLISVPVFKTYTHLPPFMGMMLGLSIMWIIIDYYLKNRSEKDKRKLTVTSIIKEIDIPTVLFFLGILSAVSALQSAGHLDVLSRWLNSNFDNLYAVNISIGLVSAIVDNVPLVAAAMGMYDIAPAGAMGELSNFVVDGSFWSFLAYCSGTGGSVLIVGSAAGVAAMGLEKIDFMWYLKKISWIALAGYLSGALFYILQANILS